MRLEADELAGVVDLFGAMARAELAEAVRELAFRRGEDFDADAHAAGVEAAVATYHLAVVDLPDTDRDESVVVGPAAFPTLPEHGQDLPHIVDIPDCTVDRAVVGRQVEERLRRDAAQAVAAEDTDRIQTLLDASYDLEAWAPVTVEDVRDRLTSALDGT
ncbi:MAG: hypothetical protein ABEJ57_00115 [Halobacteriaceae archaeon]